MIKAPPELQEEFNKEMREPIDYEVLMSFFDTEMVELASVNKQETSTLDDICTKWYSGYNDVYVPYDKSLSFTGFADFEPNAYDTMNPKRLYREPTQEETELLFEYLEKYSTRIYSNNFFYEKGTEENPFFVFTTDIMEYEANFLGITMIFGEDETIYPTNIVIEAYNSANKLVDKIVANPSSIYYTIKRNFNNIKKVKLKVLEMNRTGVKFRLSSFLFGYENVYNKEIMSINCNRTANPLSSELPSYKATVDILDLEGYYNPQNPNGAYYDLGETRMKIYCKYNGKRILVGKYRVFESPTIENNIVTICGESEFLGVLTRTESEAFDTQNGYSLYDLIEANAQFLAPTGIEFELPTEIPCFETPRNYGYVKMKMADLYSKVANCIIAIYKEDENGNVKLMPSLKPSEKPKEIFKLNENLICGEIKIDTSSPIPNGVAVNLYSQNGDNPTKVGNGNFFIDNNLVIGQDIVDYITRTYNWWIDKTQRYEIPYFSNPLIEVGDFVEFKNNFGVTIQGIVAANNYSVPASPSSDTLVVYTMKGNGA